MLRRMTRAVPLALAVAASVALSQTAHAAGDTVRYEIQSNAPLSMVTYFDYIGDIAQDTSPAGSTWSHIVDCSE
jgi:hypothetical protein